MVQEVLHSTVVLLACHLPPTWTCSTALDLVVDMSAVILALIVIGALLIVQAQLRALVFRDFIKQLLFFAVASSSIACLSFLAVYWTVGVARDLKDLEPQLSEFRIQLSESFCCTSQHCFEGDILECDRQLIFETLKHWYGEVCTLPEALEEFNRTVRVTLRKRALEGAKTATVPLSIMLYNALCIQAPLVCDAVTHLKAMWLRSEDVGVWLTFWRCLAVLSWLSSYAYLGVLFFHMFVRVCQVLFQYLDGRMSRLKMTLVLWCAINALGCLMLGVFVWPYEVLDELGYGDFWPFLAILLLLHGTYTFSLYPCRCG